MRDWRHGWPAAAVALTLLVVAWLRFAALLHDPVGTTEDALRANYGATHLTTPKGTGRAGKGDAGRGSAGQGSVGRGSVGKVASQPGVAAAPAAPRGLS